MKKRILCLLCSLIKISSDLCCQKQFALSNNLLETDVLVPQSETYLLLLLINNILFKKHQNSSF